MFMSWELYFANWKPGGSSRASDTRWVRPPWEPDGKYIPHRPCVCPRSSCHRLYKSGIPNGGFL